MDVFFRPRKFLKVVILPQLLIDEVPLLWGDVFSAEVVDVDFECFAEPSVEGVVSDDALEVVIAERRISSLFLDHFYEVELVCSSV